MVDASKGVLVVDDEQRLADLFALWLEGRWDVSVAYDGQECLEKLDESISVVLLDRRMPGLSGDEVLQEIRSREGNVRVVMVTAIDPDLDIVKMGFDDYVVKPVSKDDLVGVVERMQTLAEYDENIQRYFQLASKKALLESEIPAADLDNSDEYQTLLEEFDALGNQVDQAIVDLSDSENFSSGFRGFPDASDVEDDSS